jgi:MFS family permease
MSQAFKPYETLANRTFVGLIVAQFLAAFNDQCIHAAAMFYAISFVGNNTGVPGILTKPTAISLMPILFYAPWAIFCTLAGYLADRFSKRSTLVIWKFVELGITLIALAGFWIGTHYQSAYGPWLVLSTVFLMGTHSAFFVPAKYGVMPEILPHSLLSKGNGILESTSFMGIILGTMMGGFMSGGAAFKGREHYIGLVLVGLAVIGAIASLFIEKMPAANPTRPFPRNLLKPLWQNLRLLLRSKPLVLSVIGIAFFTFMVAFMRATMYMHGVTRNPEWDESHISLIVGTVALGIGLGSPLAGWLSGGKVELGLVPLGTVGMILATAAAALVINATMGLVACLIALGFCVGFYLVPLYALLQHRAPKTSKGDLIATSNFINVIGAITASVFFYLLVGGAHFAKLTTEIVQKDEYDGEVVQLTELKREGHRLRSFKVRVPNKPSTRPLTDEEIFRKELGLGAEMGAEEEETQRIEEVEQDFIELMGGRSLQDWSLDQTKPTYVKVSTYEIRRGTQMVKHFRLRPPYLPQKPVYDDEALPRYLFLGASLMTLGILVLLCLQLPDFFVRSLLWLRSFGRYHVRVYGIQHLPDEGAAILATNCRSFQDSMHVLAATDRKLRFLLIEDRYEPGTPLLRFLAKQTSMIVLEPGKISAKEKDIALIAGAQALERQQLAALSADGKEFEELLQGMQKNGSVPVVPVYCGRADMPGGKGKIRVIVGEPLKPGATSADIHASLEHLEGIHRQTPTGSLMLDSHH